MTQEIVNQGMQEELLSRLDALAVKLGTTSEYLWEVLIRQAQVEGVFAVFIAVSFLLAAVGLIYGSMRVYRIEGDPRIAWMFIGLFAILPGVGVIASIHTAVTCFYNPEYWALQKILETIG